MGRKINSSKKKTIIKAVEANNDQLQAAGIAKLLNLHPQEIVRILTSLEDEPEKYLCEDDKGFLSIFKK